MRSRTASETNYLLAYPPINQPLTALPSIMKPAHFSLKNIIELEWYFCIEVETVINIPTIIEWH